MLKSTQGHPDQEPGELQLPTAHPLESTLGTFRDDPWWDAMIDAIKTSEETEPKI